MIGQELIRLFFVKVKQPILFFVVKTH